MLSSEKLDSYKKQLTSTLLEALTKLNALEEEYNAKEVEFNNSYPGNTIPEHLVEIGDKIWTDYEKKFRDILREYCTDKVSEDPRSGGSMGSPTRFHFIEEKYELNFIMKSEKKAIIEINYEKWKGSCFGIQFTFSPTENGWRISCVKERLSKDKSWSNYWM